MRYLIVLMFFVCLINPIISKDVKSIDRTRLSVIYFQVNFTQYIDSLAANRYKEEYTIIKELIDANPEIDLVLNGYQNLMERANLSEERAQKVKQDLMQAGVCNDRMIIKKQPSIVIADSVLAVGRDYTQRVEFTVVKRVE